MIFPRERERVNYRLTPSSANLPSCSAGEVINQSTVDVDRSVDIGDSVGVTILQETVSAVNGGTDAMLTIRRMRIMQMLFLIIFRQ